MFFAQILARLRKLTIRSGISVFSWHRAAAAIVFVMRRSERITERFKSNASSKGRSSFFFEKRILTHKQSRSLPSTRLKRTIKQNVAIHCRLHWQVIKYANTLYSTQLSTFFLLSKSQTVRMKNCTVQCTTVVFPCELRATTIFRDVNIYSILLCVSVALQLSDVSSARMQTFILCHLLQKSMLRMH